MLPSNRLNATSRLLVLAALVITAPAAAGVVVEVDAGDHNRPAATPVFAIIPPELEIADEAWLRCLNTGQVIPSQTTTGSPRRLWWLLRAPLLRGAKRRYEFCQRPEAVVDRPGITVTDDGARLVVKLNGRSVLHYNHAVVPSPDLAKPYFARSGFLHPVFSPHGRIVTDEMPANHMHQHGIMFAWRKATFEGRNVDFWNSEEQLGRVEHVSIDKTHEGPVLGGFTVTLRHVDLTAAEGPKPAIREVWKLRVVADADPLVWDLSSEQVVLGEEPLTVNEFHYGGLMIRGNAEWRTPQDCGMLTSLGDDRQTGNHTRPRWVSMRGAVDGDPVGITVLGHPANFRAPQHVRLHPKMPYFCFAPMVAGDFQLEPNKPFKLQYRFVVNDGELSREATQRYWVNYAIPAKAAIVVGKNDAESPEGRISR